MLAARRKFGHVFDAAHCAAEDAENVAVVAAALDSGFPETAMDITGKTLLHMAAECEELTHLIPRMLAAHWDPNIKSGGAGFTPVVLACRRANLEALKLLVAGGAVLGGTHGDPDGWTVVFHALNSLKVLKWLAGRPEVDWCHVSTNRCTTALQEFDRSAIGWPGMNPECRPVITGAMAAQRRRQARWSGLRAAYFAAAGAAGLIG